MYNLMISSHILNNQASSEGRLLSGVWFVFYVYTESIYVI